MSSAFYANLPEDPEQAFLILEERYRASFDAKTSNIDLDEYFPEMDCLEYMRRTLAAATELGLPIAATLIVPSSQNMNRIAYNDFRGDVDHYATILQIRHSRRDTGFSVAFSNKTKNIILHHLNTVKDIIMKLDDIDDWKKEALLNKLAELEKEVSRDRFQYKIFAAFIIEASGVLGQAAKHLEPVTNLINSVSGLLYGSKQDEKNRSLSPPTTPKQIEPPRRADPPPKATKKLASQRMDDEIPF